MMTDFNPAPVLLRDAASTVVADDPMMFDKVSVHNVAQKKAGPDCSTKGTVLSLYLSYTLIHTPIFFPSPAPPFTASQPHDYFWKLIVLFLLSIVSCFYRLASLLHFR